MKHALVLVALIAGNAFALTSQQIENMGLQCDQVMNEGQCRVALDPKDYPNPTVLVSNVSGVSRITTASYLRIRGANQEKTVDGKWLMCTRVRQACAVGDATDDCKAALALFSTEAPVVRAPSAAPVSTLKP